MNKNSLSHNMFEIINENFEVNRDLRQDWLNSKLEEGMANGNV